MEKFSKFAALSEKVKIIKGKAGWYWRVAAGDARELYVKLNFEPGLAEYSQGIGEVTVLRVNCLYFGEAFEIPKPFGLLEKRPYEPGEGYILGKIWIPMGLFEKNLKSMHEYVRDHLCETIEQAIQPLMDAAECKSSISLKEMMELMITAIEEDVPETIKPVAYINEQWGVQRKILATKQDSKFKKFNPGNSPTSEGEDDDE